MYEKEIEKLKEKEREREKIIQSMFAEIHDDRRWVSFLIVLFGVPLLLYGTKHTLETPEEKQQTIQNEIQKQSETIVVTSVKKNMNSDYILINDTYRVKTNITIPKDTTIVIEKNTTDDTYNLIEYEIK